MTIYRRSFGIRDQIQENLNYLYESNFIDSLRDSNMKFTIGRLNFHLAQVFGFCWGVDRAISMAYESAKYFKNQKVWITNEIIHNPMVNANLIKLNIEFLNIQADGSLDFSQIKHNDVVILPAFGVNKDDLDKLNSTGCQIVDTTCPWVSRVWHRIEKYEKNNFTAIIHGKYNHEETIATSSRSNKFLIVQNIQEAQWVCDFILKDGLASQFLEKFKHSTSANFNPKEDLIKIGIANQTTMLKGETELIGKLFEQTMIKKYGPQNIDEHFMSPGDTICNATQERQDAMYDLIKLPLDFILVIGGFNSSNTSHLQEIAESTNIPSFHIDSVECLIDEDTIKHRIANNGQIVHSKNWFKENYSNIGITSGASTPNQVVASVIE